MSCQPVDIKILNRLNNWFRVAYYEGNSRDIPVKFVELGYSEIFNALFILVNPNRKITYKIIEILNDRNYSPIDLHLRALSLFKLMWSHLDNHEKDILRSFFKVEEYSDDIIEIFLK